MYRMFQECQTHFNHFCLTNRIHVDRTIFILLIIQIFKFHRFFKYLFNKLNKTVRNSTVEFTGHSQQRFPDTVPRIQSSLDNETKRQGLEKIQNKIAVRCSQKETRKKERREKE